MKFSWCYIEDKISEFQKSASEHIATKVKEFQDKHPLGDKVVRSMFTILPPPLNALAEHIYNTSKGSDEEALEKVIEFLGKIQGQGEDQYRKIIDNEETIIQNIVNLRDVTAKESSLELLKNIMVAQNGIINEKLDELKEYLSTLIVIDDEKLSAYGLNILPPDYFLDHKSTEKDLESWMNGFPFDLTSIFVGKEFRRENIIKVIKDRLEKNHRIVLLGQTGYSKTTFLNEIICNYFKDKWDVFRGDGFEGTNDLNYMECVRLLEKKLENGDKVLVAIDNIHNEGTAQIFAVMEEISRHRYEENIRFVFAARLPDYYKLVDYKSEGLSEKIRNSIGKINDEKFRYLVPPFTEQEVFDFIKLYRPNDQHTQLKSLATSIHKQTNGYPILVKFLVLGKGINQDVKFRLADFLNTPKKLKAMIICSILDISNLTIHDSLLEKMRIIGDAYELCDRTLRIDTDGTWKTIHPKWDLELLYALFNTPVPKDKYSYKELLKDSVVAIFDLYDKKIAEAVIGSMYHLCTIDTEKGYPIPIEIMRDSISFPDYMDDNTKCKLYTYHISKSYYTLKRFEEAIQMLDKAIDIDDKYSDAWCNKGAITAKLEKYTDGLRMLDKATEIDDKYEIAWINKSIIFERQKRYEDAVISLDKALAINKENYSMWSRKAQCLLMMKKFPQAIEAYDKAIEMSSKNGHKLIYVRSMNEKAVALLKLERYPEADKVLNLVLDSDPEYIVTLYNKGLLLELFNKREQANTYYEKIIKLSPDSVAEWNFQGESFKKLGREEDAQKCKKKAIELASGENFTV